jgi:hypothetical protein
LTIGLLLVAAYRDLLFGPSQHRAVRLARIAGVTFVVLGALSLVFLVDNGSGPAAVGTAAADARLEGSIGVADVTRHQQRFEPGVAVRDGDLVEVQIHGRNLSVTASTREAAVDVARTYESGGTARLTMTLGADRFTSVIDSATLTADLPGTIAVTPLTNGQVTLRTADARGREHNQAVDVATLPLHVSLPLLGAEPPHDSFDITFYVRVHVDGIQ